MERVEELISAGTGQPHGPGGKPLKNYVLVPATKKRSWIKLCTEAAEAAS